MKRLIITVLVVCGLTGCGGSNAGAGEGPANQPSAPPYSTHTAGSTIITGWRLSIWKVTKGSVDVIDNLWRAPGAARSVDVDGSVPGEMTTSFSTIPGKAYLLTFDLSANGGCADVVKTLRVSAGYESTVYSVSSKLVNAQSNKWFPKRWSFKAIKPTTTLTFASGDAPGSACGPVVANVESHL